MRAVIFPGRDEIKFCGYERNEALVLFVPAFRGEEERRNHVEERKKGIVGRWG